RRLRAEKQIHITDEFARSAKDFLFRKNLAAEPGIAFRSFQREAGGVDAAEEFAQLRVTSGFRDTENQVRMLFNIEVSDAARLRSAIFRSPGKFQRRTIRPRLNRIISLHQLIPCCRKNWMIWRSAQRPP